MVLFCRLLTNSVPIKNCLNRVFYYRVSTANAPTLSHSSLSRPLSSCHLSARLVSVTSLLRGPWLALSNLLLTSVLQDHMIFISHPGKSSLFLVCVFKKIPVTILITLVYCLQWQSGSWGLTTHRLSLTLITTLPPRFCLWGLIENAAFIMLVTERLFLQRSIQCPITVYTHR